MPLRVKVELPPLVYRIESIDKTASAATVKAPLTITFEFCMVTSALESMVKFQKVVLAPPFMAVPPAAIMTVPLLWVKAPLLSKVPRVSVSVLDACQVVPLSMVKVLAI